MSKAFSFGIGLTASDDASGAINGVIMSLETLEDRLQRVQSLTSSMATDSGGLANSLAGDSGVGMMGGAIVDNADMEETQQLTQQIGRDLRLVTNQLDDIFNGMEVIAQIGLQVRDNLAQAPPVLEQTANSAERAASEIDRIPPAARESADLFMIMHLHTQALINDLISLQQAATSIGLSELEHDAVRLTASFGESRESALRLSDAVLDTAERTAVSTDAVRNLAVALGLTGARFEQLTDADQDALSHLTGTLGMTAESAVALTSGLKATGGSLQDTLNDAAMFVKNFGVPGLIEQLPETVEAAIDAQARYGSLARRSAASITKDITRMTAVYAKSLGKTGPEAARLARESFAKFAGEIESFEDVFLGLSDDFSPLQTAFLETGMGLEDMEDLMRKAAKSPAAFAEEVLAMRDSLDPQMGERFMRQVMRNVDEGRARLLTQRDALATASEEERKAIEKEIAQQEDQAKQQQAFNNMIVDMRKNAVDAAKMFEKLLGVFRETFGVDASEVVRMGFEKLIHVAKGGLDIFNEVRNYFGAKGGLSDGFKDVASTAVAVGGGLGVVLPALRVLIGPLGGVSRLFTSIWDVGKGLAGVLTSTARGTGTLGKLFRFLGGGIGKVVWPLQAVLGAFEGVKVAAAEIGAVISDPNKTGWEKFEGVVSGVFSGVIAAADRFLFGLPSMFVEGFKKMGQGISTEGAASVGQAIGQFLGNATTMLVDFASTTLPEVGGKWLAAINAWWANFDMAEFGLKILGGLSAIGQNIIAFAAGAADGFLNAFGLPLESISVLADIAWLKLQKGITLFVGSAADMVFGLGNGIQSTFNNIGAGIEEMWAGLTHSIGQKFRGVIAGLIESFAEFVESFVKQNPRIAGFLGVTEDSVAAIRAAATGVVALSAAKEEEHQADLRRIEDSRRADNAVIAERQRLNEEATFQAGLAFDARIQGRQNDLNDLAVQHSQVPTTQSLSPTDVADRADAAGGGGGMSEAQFNALLAALTSMQNNPHVSAGRQAIEVTLRHAAAGNTHFQRALEEGLNAVVEAER